MRRRAAPATAARAAALGLALLTAAIATTASATCRQALALGLDVSGSVDSAEYALQHQGLARALAHPEVAEALLAMPAAPVSLMVYEWSDEHSIRPLVDWTVIADAATLDAVSTRLMTLRRSAMPPSTALGAAMRHGISALGTQSDCWKRTLDISGDGKSNTGPHPAPVRAQADRAGVTINALVIGADAPASGDARFVEIGELSAYFNAYVITGAEAFVETALGFDDYEAAMVRKLKRELAGLILSRR